MILPRILVGAVLAIGFSPASQASAASPLRVPATWTQLSGVKQRYIRPPRWTPALAARRDRDREAQRRALVHNSALWRHQHARNYRFRLRIACFCPLPREAVITVRNGHPHGAAGALRELDTVPEMFAAIRGALHDPSAGDVTVSYDRHLGFPRSASIDRIKNAVDDEIGWTANHFRRLPTR